jgi:hypothetical protein
MGYVEQAYSQGLLLPFAAIRNQAAPGRSGAAGRPPGG